MVSYQTASLALYGGRSGQQFARIRGTGAMLHLHDAFARVLNALVVPAPRDECIRLLSEVGIGRPLDVLTAFIVDGLLIERHADSADTLQTPIEHLSVLTSDRPSRFERCLRSYLGHCRAHGVAVVVRIVDGSRDPDNARANRDIARTTARDFGLEVKYSGPTMRSEVRCAAIRAGMPRAVIDWLMPDPVDGYGAGATRTVALLGLAGRCALMVDDDTVCVPWQPDAASEDLVFLGHRDPRVSIHFPDRSAAADVADCGMNLFAAHSRLLGKKLWTLAGGFDARVRANEACGHVRLAITDEGGPATVRVTWAGIAGDAAVHCRYPLLLDEGENRERLAADPDALALALASREVRRCARAYTVTDEATLMGYCMALDATRLLPPFDPLAFNEDGVFGSFLRLLEPRAFIAHIPLGVVHDSARPPTYEDTFMASAQSSRMCDLLNALGNKWVMGSLPSDDPGVRYRRLGAFFREAGSAPPAIFAESLINIVLAARFRLADRCHAALSGSFEYPPRWRSELIRYLTAIDDGMCSPVSFVPIEYPDASVQAPVHVEHIARHLRLFGEALELWPDIWQRATNSEWDGEVA